MNLVLKQACDEVGGQTRLASLLGTSQSMVWYWLMRSKKGPSGEYVLKIESHTSISRYALRPDLYPLNAPCTPSSDSTAGHSPASSTHPIRETSGSPAGECGQGCGVER